MLSYSPWVFRGVGTLGGRTTSRQEIFVFDTPIKSKMSESCLQKAHTPMAAQSRPVSLLSGDDVLYYRLMSPSAVEARATTVL